MTMTERMTAVRRCIAIGECMVELAPAQDGLYRLGYAGDTFNTAWYLQASLSAGEVCYASAIGTDAASAKLRSFVADSGITPALQEVPETSVGLYLIETEDGERSFSYWRSASAARQLAADPGRLPVAGQGDLLFFSGITMAILLGQGRQNLLEYLSAARDRGAIVVFDPNLRPRLWQSGDDMRHWITEAARVSDVVLPSHEDEAEHFGDADPAATGARYQALGCGVVIVKDGPGAVRILTPEGVEEVSPQKVTQLVDTTAAGDAFNAGMLSAWIGGADLAASVAAGCALSAQVIQAPGALVQL